MKYGLPYQGSKSKLAEAIVSELPAAEHFYDVFAGGCAITHAAMLSGKFKHVHANDITRTPEVFEAATRRLYEQESRWISHDEFFRLRRVEPLVSVLYSFGNDLRTYAYSSDVEPYKKALHMAVFFGDMSGISEMFPEVQEACSAALDGVDMYTERRHAIRRAVQACIGKSNVTSETARRCSLLSRLVNAERLDRINGIAETLARCNVELDVTALDYRSLSFEQDAVVYCDPPYFGTKTYIAPFDTNAFHNWVSVQGNVYISEYTMPLDRFVQVAAWDRSSKMNAGHHVKVVEKLYTTSSSTGLSLYGAAQNSIW